MTKKRFYGGSPISETIENEGGTCDIPGCDAAGHYRAPRSRHELTSYFWFCLDHVRAYNKSWNYCAGMSEDEMEHQIRADVTWNRPSWPLGARSVLFNRMAGQPHANYGAFAADDWSERDANAGGNGAGANGAGRRPRPGSDQEKALAVLDLAPPITQDAIRTRYKDLVKRHHPDANGGDTSAEERLKLINQAYATLKDGISL